jgi:hypothetical protein
MRSEIDFIKDQVEQRNDIKSTTNKNMKHTFTNDEDLRSDLDKTNKSFDHPRTMNKKKRRSNAIEETLKIANAYSESINNQQNVK